MHGSKERPRQPQIRHCQERAFSRWTEGGPGARCLHRKEAGAAEDVKSPGRGRAPVSKPLDEVTFDRVEGCGMDSALNAGKKIMTFVLDALDSAGSEIVRGRFAWRRMLPPNVSPMADITSAGG
ncbi:unnamed protein product [Ectocarpus sp. 6 AP-2014]